MKTPIEIKEKISMLKFAIGQGIYNKKQMANANYQIGILEWVLK